MGQTAEESSQNTVANLRPQPESNSSVNTTGANAGGGNSGYGTTPPPESNNSNRSNSNVQAQFKPDETLGKGKFDDTLKRIDHNSPQPNQI